MKNRIHSTLIAFGKSCPMSDLFGVAGLLCQRRDLAVDLVYQQQARVDVPAPRLRNGQPVEQLAHHRYVPPRMTAPGVGWLVGFPIATEIGDIKRFSSPRELCGYTREGRAWPPTLPAASSGLDSS